MNDILILGAGPAGMAAAMELYRAKRSFTIIEKTSRVGGLARTYVFGEFRTDNGPHRFFSKNRYLYDFIKDLLGERWIEVDRYTRFYINGKYFMYPIKFSNAMRGLGPVKSMRILFDFLSEQLRGRISGRKPGSFEDYAISRFGRSLAEFNILNYTEKVWGLPCSQIDPDWAVQRIRDLSLWTAVRNIIKKSGGPKTLVDRFYYPDMGTGLIYEEIAKRIVNDKNSSLELNSYPTRIVHENCTVKSVEVNVNGRPKVLMPKYVISSVPITELASLLHPPPPKEVLAAAEKLKFRSQVYLFITINKPRVTRDNWVYFPDKEIPFGRFHEPKNFSEKMSPPGKTSLFIEFFCWENDAVWNMKPEELFELAMEHLERLGLVRKSEVIDYFHHKEKNVYPVYSIGYRDGLETVKKYLDSFANLIFIGRPGRFKYTNQDHSLEMGILAARNVVEGVKKDVESIGAEKEYFEKGYSRGA